LAQGVQAARSFGFLAGRAQGWQQHRPKAGDDCDSDQEFDQGKSVLKPAARPIACVLFHAITFASTQLNQSAGHLVNARIPVPTGAAFAQANAQNVKQTKSS
jgi:hypothetical protein